LRYLRRSFRRGRLDVMLGDGDRLAAARMNEPGWSAERAELALLMGAAHAAVHQLATAEAYLEQGLAWAGDPAHAGRNGSAGSGAGTEPPPATEWADDPPPDAPPLEPSDDRQDGSDRRPPPPWGAVPGWPPAAPPPPLVDAVPGWPPSPWDPARPAEAPPTPGPPTPQPGWSPPPGPPAWSPPPAWAPGPAPVPAGIARARRDRRPPFIDWCDLLLCEVHLRTGRTSDAGDRLARLTESERDVTTRYSATRTQAAIAALAGRYERSHHLLNTAAGLAARIPSRFRSALIDRDRAAVLAREGRLGEALNIVDRLLGSMIRPVTGPYQRWSRTEAAWLCLTLSRAAPHTAAAAEARRLLDTAGTAAMPLADPALNAHGVIVSAAIQGAGPSGDDAEAEGVDDLEERLASAGAFFERSGDRPGAALVVLEHARLAHGRGLDRSARPLYRQAAAELDECGWRVEAREATGLLAALDAGRPPIARAR
jgi:hypothetical protein